MYLNMFWTGLLAWADKSFASVTDVSPSAGSNVTSESWAVNVDFVRVSSSSSSRRGLFNGVLRGVEVITFVAAGWETDGMLNSKLDTVVWTPVLLYLA